MLQEWTYKCYDTIFIKILSLFAKVVAKNKGVWILWNTVYIPLSTICRRRYTNCFWLIFLDWLIELLIAVNCPLQVAEHSDANLMTAQNLAVVFGPNLLWSKNEASLTLIGFVQSCTLLLITHYDDLFVKWLRALSSFIFLLLLSYSNLFDLMLKRHRLFCQRSDQKMQIFRMWQSRRKSASIGCRFYRANLFGCAWLHNKR